MGMFTDEDFLGLASALKSEELLNDTVENTTVDVGAGLASFKERMRLRNQLDKDYMAHEKPRITSEYLESWLKSIPPVYREASFDGDMSVAYTAIQALQRNNPNGKAMFFGVMKDSFYATKLCYAVQRMFISSGALKPSQICYVTEEDIKSLGELGYKRRDHLETLLHDSVQLVIIDGLGNFPNYNTQSLSVLNTLLDFVQSRGIMVCVTFTEPLKVWGERVPEQVVGLMKSLGAGSYIKIKD